MHGQLINNLFAPEQVFLSSTAVGSLVIVCLLVRHAVAVPPVPPANAMPTSECAWHRFHGLSKEKGKGKKPPVFTCL